MKLLMAGINFRNSSIEQREKLSFTPEQIKKICLRVCEKEGIEGCIVLSTCNRTEIYISCQDNIAAEGDRLLIEYGEVRDFSGEFEKREDAEAVYYLTELACGLKSQVLGEGQIAGQINSALEISREAGCTDSVLNTLFRIAVSAGKYALTNTKITAVPLSSADSAVEFLKKKYKSLRGKSCVIIGNGKMSRLIQELLHREGCEIKVTLRTHTHGSSGIMPGCTPIDYGKRYRYIEGCNIVISATRSPHFTVTYERLKELKERPDIIIDLAVPRDVEESVGELCPCYNIDSLGINAETDKDEIEAVYDIVDKYTIDFMHWLNYKLSLPAINGIKDIITKRIINSQGSDCENKNDDKAEVIAFAVDKAVDMLLGAMKDSVVPESVDVCKKKIEERARL